MDYYSLYHGRIADWGKCELRANGAWRKIFWHYIWRGTTLNMKRYNFKNWSNQCLQSPIVLTALSEHLIKKLKVRRTGKAGRRDKSVVIQIVSLPVQIAPRSIVLWPDWNRRSSRLNSVLQGLGRSGACGDGGVSVVHVGGGRRKLWRLCFKSKFIK